MRANIAGLCLCTSLSLLQAQFSWARVGQEQQPLVANVDAQLVVPNDNRHAAGSLLNGIVELLQ